MEDSSYVREDLESLLSKRVPSTASQKSLKELSNFYARSDAPKGEIVILISGATKYNDAFDEIKLVSMLTEELQKNSLRDAVHTVTQISGKSRKVIYSLAISLDKADKSKTGN